MSNAEDPSDQSRQWVDSLKSAAAELRNTPMPNPQALIRRADAISEQLLLIAGKFDPQNGDGFKQLSDRAMQEARGAGGHLVKHLKDHTADALKKHAESLRALAVGFKECASLLRDMEKQPGNRESHETRALYWMKELKDTDALTESYVTVCDLAGAVEKAHHSHVVGDTPWEQEQRDSEIKDMMAGAPAIDPKELDAYVRKAVQRYRETAFNQLDDCIIDTMTDFRTLNDDLHPEQTAGDLLLAIAGGLLGTPSEKEQPQSRHRR